MFEGKTCVITGASRGLGLGLAQHFAELGFNLALCSRSLSEAPQSLGADVVWRRLDVSDPQGLRELASTAKACFGSIDLWINNAAVLEPICFLRELSAEAFMQHLRINVLGVLNGTQAFVEHLRARRAEDPQAEGVLINLSSGAALKGYPAWTAYCAGKAAVDRLTECVQLEEGEQGLRAYAVAPGVIDTDMQRTIRAQTPEQFPLVEKFHELKRREAFNTPTYVAQQLLALAFDPAARPADVVTRLEPQNP